MKKLKSILWTINPLWLLIGILVLVLGHSHYGWLVILAAVREKREYYEENK